MILDLIIGNAEWGEEILPPSEFEILPLLERESECEDDLLIGSQHKLAQLERQIAEGQQAFYQIGSALKIIREERLYYSSHSDFDTYCQQKWDMSKRKANYLIKAAGVIDNLNEHFGCNGNNCSQVPMPTNESQVRELAKLSPEEQREVWENVVGKVANGEALTAKLVKNTIGDYKDKVANGAALIAKLAGKENLADKCDQIKLEERDCGTEQEAVEHFATTDTNDFYCFTFTFGDESDFTNFTNDFTVNFTYLSEEQDSCTEPEAVEYLHFDFVETTDTTDESYFSIFFEDLTEASSRRGESSGIGEFIKRRESYQEWRDAYLGWQDCLFRGKVVDEVDGLLRGKLIKDISGAIADEKGWDILFLAGHSNTNLINLSESRNILKSLLTSDRKPHLKSFISLLKWYYYLNWENSIADYCGNTRVKPLMFEGNFSRKIKDKISLGKIGKERSPPMNQLANENSKEIFKNPLPGIVDEEVSGNALRST